MTPKDIIVSGMTKMPQYYSKFHLLLSLATDVVYSDLDADKINRLPDTAFHRNVDLVVLSASPKVKTHIILPPAVYGIADHALAQKGISNPISVLIPMFIRYGIDRGQAGMVGKGLNVWPCVHISERTCLPLNVIIRGFTHLTFSCCGDRYSSRGSS